MIIVIVKVHEPANPDAGTIEEDVIIGIFHGFETEAQAIAWIEDWKRKWKVSPNTIFNISSSEHYSTLIDY